LQTDGSGKDFVGLFYLGDAVQIFVVIYTRTSKGQVLERPKRVQDDSVSCSRIN
jgi:hypothetical protein